jgi:hypothetical protein
MLGTYFYHEIIRKTVVSFGTIFNQIYIKHTDSDSDVISELRVPLAYGPMQKFLARIEQQPNLNKPIQITLPRMSFELNGIEYDPSRKSTVTQTFSAVGSNDKIRKVYMPVPYNLKFELNILTKLNDDMLQIIEQILPFFQPSFALTVDLIDSIGEKKDIAIVLDGINIQDDYEGDLTTRRALIYTLQFTAKSFMFGPIANDPEGLIRKVQIDYHSNTNINTSKREIRYTVTPTAMKDYDSDSSATLQENLNTLEQSVNVNNASTISNGDRIIIDNEIMYVKSKSENTIIVNRGYDNTSQSEHSQGAIINILSSYDNSQIVPGDDFGFSEETLFFNNSATYSPTRKIDVE